MLRAIDTADLRYRLPISQSRCAVERSLVDAIITTDGLIA